MCFKPFLNVSLLLNTSSIILAKYINRYEGEETFCT